MMKVGERCMNMMRAFNIREGFTRQDDRLPDRFHHQPLPAGPLKGFKLNKEKFEKAIKTYLYANTPWSGLRPGMVWGSLDD